MRRVHALMQRLAEKDESTEEHTRRVALRAVQVGEELGLPPGRLARTRDRWPSPRHRQALRAERILQKPAALSEDEFAVIKRHPEWGVKLLRELGGFNVLGAGTRPQPPRAARRQGLSARPGGGLDRPRHTHPHRLRRLRRARLATRLSRCVESRGRARASSARRSAPRSTSAASPRSSACSAASRCSRNLQRFASPPRPSSRRAPSARRSGVASSSARRRRDRRACGHARARPAS